MHKKSQNSRLETAVQEKEFAMLQTIEVEIDAKGHIHPLEKLPLLHKGKLRALLTILPDLPAKTKQAAVTGLERPAFGVY